MHTKRRPLMFLLAATACALVAAACAPARDCVPRVEAGWLRLPPGGMPMLAGFARIDNPCAVPAVVVAARSARFGDVSLHETQLVDGISRMRAVPRLAVPARGEVSLQPGGLHLMLMDPRAPVKAGERIEVEFELEDGRVLRSTWPVRDAAG